MLAYVPPLPKSYIDGCHYSPGTDTQHDIDITDGVIRDDTDAVEIHGTGALTIALDASGANGLDATDTLANEEWYAIFVCWKADGTVAGFASSLTTLGSSYEWADIGTQPTDYIYGRRIGWVRTNGTANLHQWIQSLCPDNRRWVHWNTTSTADIRIQQNGTATTFSDASSDQPGADRIPPTARRALILVQPNRFNSSSGYGAMILPTNSDEGGRGYRVQAGMAVTSDETKSVQFLAAVDPATQNYRYRNSNTNGNVTVNVNGWEDEV